MPLAEIKIYCEGSFITYGTLNFYSSILNIKTWKVIIIPECESIFPSVSTRQKDPDLVFSVITNGSIHFGSSLAVSLCVSAS
jgi:hypothetical protein